MDTGVLGAYRRIDEHLIATKPEIFGMVLENFVFTEILKIITGMFALDTDIYYFRNQSKVEVDFVLERGEDIIAVEVKASSMISSGDLKGIHTLHARCGSRLKAGIILHPGENIRRLGDQPYFLVPVSALWLA